MKEESSYWKGMAHKLAEENDQLKEDVRKTKKKATSYLEQLDEKEAEAEDLAK